jgi:hypothetical protein
VRRAQRQSSDPMFQQDLVGQHQTL